MMKNKHIILFSILSVLLLQGPDLLANNGDFMRSTGKIYVVVAVIVVIFLGLAFWLWRIDNKLTNLERQIKDSDEWTR